MVKDQASDLPDAAPSSSGRSPFIERVIETSARNKFLVLIFVIFGIAAGIWALERTPLDAIPDLSDVRLSFTPIGKVARRSVEDQIVSGFFEVHRGPESEIVRESMFGKSFVYVIFQDGIDIYWARSGD
jgi:Cu(I)/Ag(I) efflux system membrane protein CusA/SilA